MVKLSKMTDYGIVVLTFLVRNPKSSIHNARDIAEKTQIPLPTVSKVLKVLAKNEILESIRGVNGGYRLKRSGEQISIAEIVRAMDGPIALTECSTSPGQCDQESSCPVGGHWLAINRTVERALEELRIHHLAEPRFIGRTQLQVYPRGPNHES